MLMLPNTQKNLRYGKREVRFIFCTDLCDIVKKHYCPVQDSSNIHILSGHKINIRTL